MTEQRTKTEFAACMRHVCDVLYPHAVTIRVVLDNLTTPSGPVQDVPAAEAQRLATRLEFHFTPKHGSWLNAVEIEFAVLSRQCLDRRIDSVERLRSEVEAWSRKRNQKRVGVEWRFTTDDARQKLPCL